jgi:hypothetical protein
LYVATWYEEKGTLGESRSERERERESNLRGKAYN